MNTSAIDKVRNKRQMSTCVLPSQISVPKKGGFTLVELLVVISIIGLLAGLGIPAINRGLDASKAAGCANNLKQMGIAVQGFAADHDGYLLKMWNNQGPFHMAPFGTDESWGYPQNEWAGWDRVLLDYLSLGTVGANGNRRYTEKTASICRCPGDKTKGNVFSNYVGAGSIPNSYRFNASMLVQGQERPVKMNAIPSPSKLILIVDGVWKNRHHVRLNDSIATDIVSRTVSNNVATTRHSGAANYLFADGHVERLKWSETWDRTAPGADPSWGLWKQ